MKIKNLRGNNEKNFNYYIYISNFYYDIFKDYVTDDYRDYLELVTKE